MPSARTFTIKFTDENGSESDTRCKQGDLVSKLVDTVTCSAEIGGEMVDGSVQLRAGDHLTAIRKSAKGAC